MGRVQGKVAVITGSGSGMGRAAALLFASEGAKLVVVDIHEANGQAVVDEIKKGGGDAIFVRVDTGKEADLKRMVDEAVKAYARVDIFWHNAGIAGPGSIEQTTEEEFDRQIAIHVKGGFFGAKHVLPVMRKGGGGVILFTSSASGVKASPASPSYSIAKAGLQILAQCIALANGRYNIRANAICPGPVQTPLWPSFVGRNPEVISPADLEKAFLVKVPMGRMMQPEEIARAGLFLCSDDASAITGVLLPVDGGFLVT
ncbi:MAG: SDR family oxidoreductase [Burkholderiaceae bacterium]|uniref:SDR family NAD(P)-dependent oxidoreductase n=1 Tax=unclassified Polaromonas TaxID=2638319 RepID=UPI000BBBFC2B|nr:MULTISPECIES: SDR family oxidoreductase [unclassified Polaromonas]MDO8777890.1 SDR family oxidoreductase [Burkholderiaceae bacterium]MDP2451355.1 SDR family oxidoreductase [Polaromonas sp.]MDP3828298.1 SDR family oxidoreductase [Polaromonas sp.]